jgi:DeoR/GlpR family transcriptional regulator of sugar metabolism
MICFQNFIQLPESKQVEIITNPIDVANIVSNKPTILEIYVKGKMHQS